MQGRRGLTSRQPSGRLPTIAPRSEQPSSSRAAQGTSLASSIVSDLPSVRTRLPPRSRSGCWTCRTRKVKCDEAKPTCNQCARLGHICDYGSRLAFKDETTKYVGRFLGAVEATSYKWHPAAESQDGSHPRPPITEDCLPSFASLSTDEERQAKAEYRPPGTYFVVVNLSSFADLEEYKIIGETGETGMTVSAIPNRRPAKARRRNANEHRAFNQATLTKSPLHLHHGNFGDESSFLPMSPGRASVRTSISTRDIHNYPSANQDPDVVILTKFEDVIRKPLPPSATSTRSSGPEDLSPSAPASMDFTRRLERTWTSQEPLPFPAHTDFQGGAGRNSRLEIHYRTFVRRHLLQVDRSAVSTPSRGSPLLSEDLFERQAAIFPPLFHAIMALSALSLAHKDGVQNVDALQYYQQALAPLQNNLRSPQDLASDGAFLTHFVLLLYEIAAAEPGGTDLWSQQHLTHLLRITEFRREVYSTEPYPYITWAVCMIDTYAVLSGSGTGEYVETMLKNNLIPNAIDHLPPLDLTGPCTIYPEESETLPQALEFNRTIAILAARLGHLARRIRAGLAQRTYEARSVTIAGQMEILHRRQRIEDLKQELRRTWNTQMPTALVSGYRDANMPERVRFVFENSYALYRLCIIYSQTSMWATQRMDTGPGDEDEVSQSVSEILQLASDVIVRRQLERRFIIFPIFMAGFATKSAPEKVLALEFITAMERESIGRNTRATRELLQAVYEKQNTSLRRVGHAMDVDWIQVMHERGLQVVHCGL